MAATPNDESRLADLLPDGCVLLEYAVSIKALDEDGDIVLLNYRTPGLAAWEALGMLTCAADTLRARMQEWEAT
ncbi:hypothetical protein B4N89_27775 [Embleya scabrispora]|uniref:Uncharacterized protein n=1 Tax=Embleya scabrispora TaxID=159449 RepID=A0A1T3P5E6_9ACTN|nr:hypothetical protein [Embleya scabrispora]OPC84222.1 hypothetical protein B4N89_27775 [Embleya scabrispora]